MRSEHADFFNHDEDAPDYDRDVLRESDPIRTGYQECLDWVAGVASRFVQSFATLPVSGRGSGLPAEERERIVAVDLGAGTGNLTDRLPRVDELIAVDVSTEMLQRAKAKLTVPGVIYEQNDLLSFVCDRGPLEAEVGFVASTYAIHHLTEPEKQRLLREVARILPDRGLFVCGDLMLESPRSRASLLQEYRDGDQPHVAEAIEEEFFWDLSSTREVLDQLFEQVELKRFSALSWGIAAARPRREPK